MKYQKFSCFHEKNTNTLTPFPNCEHLKKTSHTQLSNPKKGELKNIYKRSLVDLRYLSWLLETSWPFWPLISRLLPEPRERKVVWTNWRSGDFPSEMIKMNLLHHHDSKILSVPKMEVNVVMNWSLCSWGIQLISFRYSAPVSIPRNKIDRFDWFYTSPVDIWNSAPEI